MDGKQERGERLEGLPERANFAPVLRRLWTLVGSSEPDKSKRKMEGERVRAKGRCRGIGDRLRQKQWVEI